MKIQINSLEALERLIGGDNEMEIQVRNSVVQAFTNKHLKGLVTEYVKAGYLEGLKQTISKEVFSSTGGWNAQYSLNPVYRDSVEIFIKTLLREEVNKIIEDLKASLKIEQIVNSTVSYQVSIEVERIRKELIEDEARRQIKSKFG